MPDTSDNPIITDGTTVFSGGVDSLKVTTIASPMNPGGLRRDQMAWLINGTVRDGGIRPRWGWQPKCQIADGTQRYQRGIFYQPVSGDPYGIFMIGGHILKVEPDSRLVTDLSEQFVTGGSSVVTVTGILTVTMRNDDDNLQDNIGRTRIAGTDPVIGSYSEFVIPPVGSTVEVQITAPYLGALGIQVTFPAYYHGGPQNRPAANYTIMASNGWTTTAIPGSVPTMPGNTDRGFFCQAEQFLIIQAGDNTSLPLFWDGNLLRRSLGITNTAVAPGTPGVNEIPAAGPMCYYMGRLWYAQGRFYSAGDIVGGAAGTVGYQFRDAVLNVTENPLVVGGDGFAVPDNSGDIVALQYMGNINTAQGEGQLYVFTNRAIYALTVPVTRADWIGAGNNNQPLQTVVQLANGAVNDGSVVAVNGDLYFQSFEPGIRSLVAAIRYFQQPGNIQISANENRILQLNNRALMKYASGMEFDSRLLQTSIPFEVPCGVAHRTLVPLDFIPVSSFNEQYNPIWEGHYEGLDFLQVFSTDFNGEQRAFATVLSRVDNTIWLWELVAGQRFENGDQRITMQVELPAYTWGHVEQLKRLVSGEVWLDEIYGTIEIAVDYRVDGENCWIPWLKWKECFARSSAEFKEVTDDPYAVPYGTGYVQTVSLPAPPKTCSHMARPSDRGYQFQPRITIKGACRIRGFLLHAVEVKRRLYDHLAACESLGLPSVYPVSPVSPVFPPPPPPPTPPPPAPPVPEPGVVLGNPDVGFAFGVPGTDTAFGIGP